MLRARHTLQINFKFTGGYNSGATTGDNYIIGGYYIPPLTDAQRQQLLSLGSTTLSRADIKRDYTAAQLAVVPADGQLLDGLQLLRVGGYLALTDELCQQEAVENVPAFADSACYESLVPGGTRIAGRSPRAQATSTPFVQEYAPNNAPLDKQTAFDDVQTAPLMRADFNADSVAIGALEFLYDQVKKICPPKPGAAAGSDVDEDCFMMKAKTWIATDGKPGVATQKALQAQPHRHRMIRHNAGDLHLEKQMWKSIHRLSRKVCLSEILKGHRDTAGKLDWFFLDSEDSARAKGGGDHRQVSEEKAQIVLAFWYTLRQSMALDPSLKGKAFTSAQVIARAQERAAHSPLYYMILLDMRLTEMVYSIREATKNGGDHDMHLAMVRTSSLVLTITGAHLYIKLSECERLLWLTESTFVKATYTALLWLRKTATGDTEAADLWVEKMVGLIRFRHGKKSLRNMDEMLFQFMLRLKDAVAMRGSCKNAAKPRDPATVKVGTVKVGRVLGCAIKNFTELGIHGIGNTVDGGFRVRGPGNTLVAVACGSLACLNGDAMDAEVCECMVTASQRLEAMYEQNVFGTGGIGGDNMADGWNKRLPTSVGSLANVVHDQAWRDTCTSPNTMGTRVTKCKAVPKEPLFNKALLSKYLRHIRDAGAHSMAHSDDVPVPQNAQTAALMGKTPPTAGSEPFAMSAPDQGQLLADLRRQSGMEEVAAQKKKRRKVTDCVYPTGAPSAAALAHHVFKNALATALAVTPDALLNSTFQECADGRPQQKFQAAGGAVAAAAEKACTRAELVDAEASMGKFFGARTQARTSLSVFFTKGAFSFF